jgi:hypothetical protein
VAKTTEISGLTSRLAGRRRGVLLVWCGAVLLPWVIVLATSLPARYGAAHWAAAWVGLDTLEAAGLITTGLLALRGDRRLSAAAAATATLLTVDAWFDMTTSATWSDFRLALAMALCAELPLAALCARLALSPRRKPQKLET